MANKYLEKVAETLKRRISPGEEDFQKHAPKSTKAARGLLLGSAAGAVGALATTHRPALSKGLLAGTGAAYLGGIGSAIYAGHKAQTGVNKTHKIVKKDRQGK